MQVQSMGIQEFQAAIANNTMTVKEVVAVLDARIERRKAAGKPLIAKVVSYRNELAQALNGAGGMSIPAVPVPTYTKKADALPTDPVQLADVVFATVGPAKAADLINRLTQRIAGITH